MKPNPRGASPFQGKGGPMELGQNGSEPSIAAHYCAVGMPSPVQLVTQELVCSCSEAWRHECEAADILDMPTKKGRADRLEAIGRKRGQAALERLQVTIMQLHKRAK